MAVTGWLGAEVIVSSRRTRLLRDAVQSLVQGSKSVEMDFLRTEAVARLKGELEAGILWIVG